MTVVQARLAAVEKEQKESELLLMSTALIWVGEARTGCGGADRLKKKRNVPAEIEEREEVVEVSNQIRHLGLVMN